MSGFEKEEWLRVREGTLEAVPVNMLKGERLGRKRRNKNEERRLRENIGSKRFMERSSMKGEGRTKYRKNMLIL